MSCATGTERLIRRAVPATLDETLGAFEDPDTQRRLKQLVDRPDVQEAARRLAKTLAQGAFEGLTDEQRLARLQEISEDFVGALTGAVGEHLGEDVSPALAEIVEQSVQRALDTALAPGVRRRAGELADVLTRRTVRALSEETGRGLREDLGPAVQAMIEDNLGPAMGHALREDLGPAMRHVIREDLGPAVRETLAEDVLPGAGKLSREVTREAVLGVFDALAALETDPRLQAYNDRFWGRLDTTINRGIQGGQIAAWVLGLLVLLLVLLLVRSLLQRRHIEEERARSERMLIGVLHALQRGGEVRVDQVIERVAERDPELVRSNYIGQLLQRAVAGVRDFFDGDGPAKPPSPPPRA